MPKITFLPHAELCPQGKTIEAPVGQTLLDAALAHHIFVEHACEKSCACTTCHLIIHKGFDALTAPCEREEDLLDRAWGLEPTSRLGCQVILTEEDLEVEIPKYSINQT